MTGTSMFPFYADTNDYTAKDLSVAYDISGAADTCLRPAIMLSKRFGSKIHLLSVQTPAEYMNALDAGPYAMAASQRDIETELSGIQQ